MSKSIKFLSVLAFGLSTNVSADMVGVQDLLDPDLPACSDFYQSAETKYNIPPAIIEAIAQVESGYQAGGAWPWAVNIDGQAFYGTSMDDALTAITNALTQGISNIDIGCMQINWRWHKGHASSPAVYLDPRANVYYAAYHLASLKEEFGNWKSAIGAYYSRQPARMEEYYCKVISKLQFVSRFSEKKKRAIARASASECPDYVKVADTKRGDFVADSFLPNTSSSSKNNSSDDVEILQKQIIELQNQLLALKNRVPVEAAGSARYQYQDVPKRRQLPPASETTKEHSHYWDNANKWYSRD